MKIFNNIKANKNIVSELKTVQKILMKLQKDTKELSPTLFRNVTNLLNDTNKTLKSVSVTASTNYIMYENDGKIILELDSNNVYLELVDGKLYLVYGENKTEVSKEINPEKIYSLSKFSINPYDEMLQQFKLVME